MSNSTSVQCFPKTLVLSAGMSTVFFRYARLTFAVFDFFGREHAMDGVSFGFLLAFPFLCSPNKHRVPPSQHLVPSHRMFNLGRLDLQTTSDMLADTQTPTSQPSRSLREFQEAKRTPFKFGNLASPPSHRSQDQHKQYHVDFLRSHLLTDSDKKPVTEGTVSSTSIERISDASDMAPLLSFEMYRSKSAPQDTSSLNMGTNDRNSGMYTANSDRTCKKTPKHRHTQKYELDSSVFSRPPFSHDHSHMSSSTLAADDSPPFAHFGGGGSMESPSVTPQRARGQNMSGISGDRTSTTRSLSFGSPEDCFLRHQSAAAGFTRLPLFGDPLLGLGSDLASPRMPGFECVCIFSVFVIVSTCTEVGSSLF